MRAGEENEQNEGERKVGRREEMKRGRGTEISQNFLATSILAGVILEATVSFNVHRSLSCLAN